AGCVASGATVTCTDGTVAVGASTTFTIVVTVNSNVADGTLLSNSATVSATEPDPVTTNNTASATTTVQNRADLSLAKSDGVTTVAAGTSTTYTITLTNNGPATEPAGVVIKDTIPANTTASTSDARCTIASGVPTCTTNATLAMNASTSFALTLAVASDFPGASLTNAA